MAGPIRIAILANGRQARTEATLTARAYTGLGRSLARIGAGAGLAALTFKAIGFAKESVNLEAKFSQTMNTIAAATGTPARKISELSALAIKLGQDTSFSANDAADSMLDLAKAGVKTRDIMGGGVAGTLTLAAAGGTELGTAATIASNAMNAFSIAGKDMGKIAAALAGGANASSASVESLGLGLSQVGAGAVNAGLSLQETVGALSAFDAAGVKSSDAGTSLKTMLARLVPQTTKAKDAMADLGLDFVKSNGEFLSMAAIAGELKREMSGLSAAQRTTALNTIFGSDASRAASILMRQGTAGIRKFIKATRDQDAAQKMAAARMSGTSGALEKLSGSVETAQLRLGQALAPTVQSIANGLSKNLVPAMDAGIDAAAELGDALAPGVRAIADALGDLIPDADQTSSIFHDKLIPAITTLSELTADVVGVIDDLPGPIKEVGVQAVIAAFLLPRLTSGVTSVTGAVTLNIARLKQWSAEMTYAETRTQNTAAAMQRFGGAVRSAAGIGGMVALAQGTQETSRKLGTLETAAGGALLGFSVGGPYGAAIGAGAGALYGLTRSTDSATDSMKAAKRPAIDFAKSLDKITGAATRASRETAKLALEQSGALTSAKMIGISTRDLVGATVGDEAALKRVTATIRAAEEGLRILGEQGKLTDGVYRHTTDAINSVRSSFETLSSGFRRQQREVQEVGATILAFRRALKGIPRGVRSKIEATGIKPTLNGVTRIARQYKLLDRRELRALIKASGADVTVKAIRRAIKALDDAGPAADDTSKSLKEVGKDPPNLRQWANGVLKGVQSAKRPAGTEAELIGVAMKAGVVGGFSGVADQLAAMAASAVRAAIAAARQAGGIKSPSRVMRDKVGRELARGLVVGMHDQRREAESAGKGLVESVIRGADKGSQGVGTVLDRLNQLINKKLDGRKQAGHRKALLKSLRDEYASLRANGRAQDALDKKYRRATDNLKNRLRAAGQFAKGINDGLTSFGSVVGLGTTGGGTTVGLQSMISQLTARADAVEKFSAIIRQLTAAKLNKSTLRQILDAAASGDLEGALASASAIASGGASAIAEINAQADRIGSIADRLGDKMKDKFFGAGINAAEGLVRGLEKRRKALDKVAERLAETLVNRIKKSLGIRSPSQRFREIGRQSVAGLTLELKAGQTHVRRNAADLAASMQKGFGTPALDAVMSMSPASTSSTGVTQIELTAQQLSEVEKGRKIQVSIDAYRAAGGRAKVGPR